MLFEKLKPCLHYNVLGTAQLALGTVPIKLSGRVGFGRSRWGRVNIYSLFRKLALTIKNIWNFVKYHRFLKSSFRARKNYYSIKKKLVLV